MPTYTLSSGVSFETTVLPKGTVLFRGMDPSDGYHKDIYRPFGDLFGKRSFEGNYCVSPHQNVFFYPAPYVSDVVNRYAIHTVFLTNYDIELVLAISPGKLSRDDPYRNPLSPFIRCVHASPLQDDTDACGHHLVHSDSCLSDLLINEYPNVLGYITLASQDSSRYKTGYTKSAPQELVKQTLPFVANEYVRKLSGIPEVVIYPYHVRTDQDTRFVHRHALEDAPINYSLKHRPELNYFPLLYITEQKTLSFYDLYDKSNLEHLATVERANLEFDSELPKKIQTILESALSPSGIDVNGVKYNFTIDLRTGFYVAKHSQLYFKNSKNQTQQNSLVRMYRQGLNDEYIPENKFVVPFSYPAKLKKDIHGFLARTFARNMKESDIVNNLSNLQYSFSRHFQFPKTRQQAYEMNYKLESAFPRPDLKFTKKRRGVTRKKKN